MSSVCLTPEVYVCKRLHIVGSGSRSAQLLRRCKGRWRRLFLQAGGRACVLPTQMRVPATAGAC